MHFTISYIMNVAIHEIEKGNGEGFIINSVIATQSSFELPLCIS